MDNYAELSDGFEFEADNSEDLLDQLVGYRDYELRRIREINGIIQEIENKNLDLSDDQLDMLVEETTNITEYLVEDLTVDGNIITITLDMD